MMPMTPENALYLAKQHAQDILREAEADRMYREVQSGSAHPAVHLLAPIRAALAVMARVGQHPTREEVTPAEKASGAALPVATPSTS